MAGDLGTGEMGGSGAYAGFWRRFAAYLIDNLLLTVAAVTLIFVIVGVVMLAGADRDVGGIFATLVWVPSVIAYYIVMESSPRQATFGKMAMAIRVTDLQGGRITPGRAAGRYFAKILSLFTLLIGFVMAGFTPRRQALHDMVAGTLVVRQQHPGM